MSTNCSCGNNRRFRFAASLILASASFVSGALGAETYVTGEGRAVDPALQFAADNKLIPDLLDASARSAALNAVNAMSLGSEPPSKFAIGFQLNIAGGPTAGEETVIFDLPKNPNASFNTTPIFFPARGGSSASRFYFVSSGSLINLRRDYIVGVHGAFHNMTLTDSGSVNLLEDPAGESKKWKMRMRSRELGVRLSIPVFMPKSKDSGWNGIRFITGATYAWHRTNLRGASESRSYLELDPALDITSGNNILTVFRKLETQVTIENDSRNLVVPFELMTGLRLGFLRINLGPGLALNFGRHDVTAKIDAVVCNFAPADCSTREASFFLWNNLLDPSINPLSASNVLNPTVVTLLDKESAPFLIYGNKRIHSRAILPYWTLELRLEFSYVHMIIRAAGESSNLSSSIAFEARI